MKIDIWMPLYIADYLADTSRLTTEQHGAYLLILMDYWRNGAPPDDDMVLSQITRMSPDAWSIARASIQHFFDVENNRWTHRRVEKELLQARDKKEVHVARAKAAAQKRWGNVDAQRNATSIAISTPQEMLEQCPSPSPSHKKNIEGKKSRATALPDDFYPDETGVEYAADRGVDLKTQLEQFKNFHTAKGSTYKNWQAAWRTWVGNAVSFGKVKPKEEAPWARAI